MRRTQNQFIPDLLLERYLLGEMSKAELRKFNHLLTNNEEAQQRLDALRISNREIMAKYPTSRIVSEVNGCLWTNSKAPSPKVSSRQTRFWLKIAPAAGIAVILIGMALGFGFWDNTTHGFFPEVTRIKGIFLQPQLFMYRKHGKYPEKLHNGAMARQGELLQFGYMAAHKTHGVIFSVDGRGVVTLHYPERADGSSYLKFDRAIFAYSYELDDAPYFERFFFVTANQNINVSQVLEAARKLARDHSKALTEDLDLPAKFGQTSFFIKKEDLP